LSKKYPSIFSDLDELGDELAINPTQGKSLGGNYYKVRLAISSKGKGKSGGARLITFVKIIDEQVYLSFIYDKSEKEDITKKEFELIKSQFSDLP
jgi:hypothetical protein